MNDDEWPSGRNPGSTSHWRIARASSWFVTSLLVLVAGGLLLSRSSHSSLAATVQESSYFRLKIGLSHKGEPIDMDIVVGCGVRITSDHYSGASVDIMSMYPFVYAMPISGGHAVLVRTREISGDYRLCRGGTTANGVVPKDWLPLIVWYDNADDLSHGIAYLTQDAYENPNAQLEFHGATVERAAKQDFDEFLATKPKNLVPEYNADWMSRLGAPFLRSEKDVTPEIAADPRKAWRLTSRPTCRAVKRLPLTEEQKARVRTLWPQDRPKIWAPSDPKLQDDLRSKMLMYQRGIGVIRFQEPDTAENRAKRSVVFPISVDDGLARLNKDTGKDGTYYHDILLGDGIANKGFAYCDSDSPNALETFLTGRPVTAFLRTQRTCRFGHFVVPVKPTQCDGPWWVVFEDDEYAIMAIDEFGI